LTAIQKFAKRVSTVIWLAGVLVDDRAGATSLPRSAAVRWSIREHGGEPSSRQVDELLDERYELRPGRRKRAP